MVAGNSGESRSRSARSTKEGWKRVNNNQNGEKKEYKPFKKEFKSDYKKNDGSERPFKKKNYDRNFVNSYDKDEEDNVRPQKRQSTKENKVKEQQPDKVEIMNRIEREKKAIQKKQAERKNSKPSRVQNRPKRTNNIDWTREYENDSYDDLDMY